MPNEAMTSESVARCLPGDSYNDWGRRIRARMAAPPDTDPLAGTFVLEHRTLHQEFDSRGRHRTMPLTLEFDVLADKRTMRVVAHRYINGAVEWVGGSGEPTDRVETVSLPRQKPSDPDAKPTDKVTRMRLEAKSETTIDDDGVEHEADRRARRAY